MTHPHAPGRRTAAAALALVAGLVASAACASSSSSSSSSTTTAAPPTSRASSTTAGVNPAPGQAPSSSSSASGTGFSTTGDFCTDLRTLADAPSVAADTADPAAGFRQLAALKAEAPPELQDVFDLITTAIVQLGTTDATDPSAVQRAYAALTDPKYEAGFQRLTDYAQTRCGVQLGATAGGGGPSGAAG